MRVLDAALGSVWAMEEPALRQLLEVAARENSVTPQALEAYRAAAVDKAEAAKQRDGVGILDVSGALFKRGNLFTAISGGSSYDVLMRDFQALLDDSNVRAILLNVDSPGGEAAGCAELAAAIAKARGAKPIVAYVGDLGASAAYWIASACDSIVVGASAAVGSVGVRMSMTDTSDRDARSGVRKFDFVSSQSPHKISDPKTDDGNARLQARVDALASVFVETVAANRGVSVGHVLDAFGKGDVLIGAAAVNAGMADSVGTFESVLATLSTQSDPFATIGFVNAAMRGNPREETATMPTEQELNAAVERARVEATAAAAEVHNAALASADEAAIVARTQAAVAATAAERERVSGLHAATFAGYEADRDEAIRSGSSVAAFKGILVDKEHAKAAARAKAVGVDVKVAETIAPARVDVATASEGDKAAAFITAAMAKARG